MFPRASAFELGPERAALYPVLMGVLLTSKPPVACMPGGCLVLELELPVTPAFVEDWVACILLLFELESFDACCG